MKVSGISHPGGFIPGKESQLPTG